MANYKKQNFKDGTKLNASMLNHMESGIVSLEKALAKQKVKEINLFKDNELGIVGGELVLENSIVPINIVNIEPTK